MNGGVLIMKKYLEGDTNTLNSIIYVLCISIICRTNRRYGNDSFAYFSNIIAFNSNWRHFKSESKVLVSNNPRQLHFVPSVFIYYNGDSIITFLWYLAIIILWFDNRHGRS